jgi:NAD(P)-dependent dehydrogenase (short-subunit alcohol dehydrogenase family)
MSVAQDRSLQHQRALVTGATSGIGRAIALQLARDGAEVIVHGRDAARGANTVEAITAAGGRARFVAAELSTPAESSRLAQEVGDVDVLVNNAGFSVFGPTAELQVEQFDALFASNVRAPFFLVAALAPGMVARGQGSIINIGSMAGEIGLAGAAAYGATKASLSSMTRAWAAEFSPSGVRVNAVAPGPVHTGGASSGRSSSNSGGPQPSSASRPPRRSPTSSPFWPRHARATSRARSSRQTAAAPRSSPGSEEAMAFPVHRRTYGTGGMALS